MIRSPLSGEPITVRRAAAAAPDKRMDELQARNDALVARLLAAEDGAKSMSAMVLEATRAATKALELCGTIGMPRPAEKPDAILEALAPRIASIESAVQRVSVRVDEKIDTLQRGMGQKFAEFQRAEPPKQATPALTLAPVVPITPRPLPAPAPVKRAPVTVNIVERDANSFARTFDVPSHNLTVSVTARDANNRATSFVVNHKE